MQCHLAVTCLAIVAPVLAQEPAPDAPAMPDPKTEHHVKMEQLAGTWRIAATTAAVPGIEGMEKPSTWTGYETAELICNGMWLKVMSDSRNEEQAHAGIWLLGYDSIAGVYKCVFAADAAEGAGELDAVYDDESRTWTFTGDTKMGNLKSVFVMHDKDRSVETVYAIGDDGKETQTMQIERTRHSGAIPKNAVAKPAKAADAPAALTALIADCGAWNATMKMVMPGMPAMESECREVVGTICNGRWTWSDYTGDIMGAPFEGHALTGWDADANKVISYWIDSMSPGLMRTEGTYDADAEKFALQGKCYNELGKLWPVKQTSERTENGGRQIHMTFGEGEGQHVMTIRYRRAKK